MRDAWCDCLHAVLQPGGAWPPQILFINDEYQSAWKCTSHWHSMGSLAWRSWPAPSASNYRLLSHGLVLRRVPKKHTPPHHISIFCTWGIHPSAPPLATLRHCMGSVSIFYNPSIWFHREFEISSICRYLSFNVLTSSLSSRSSCVIYPLMSMYVMHLSCRKSICVVILLLYTPVILITSFFIHGFLLV